MIFASLTAIADVIKARPNNLLLTKGRADNVVLAAHVAGIGIKQRLEQITGFENEDQKITRTKYAKSNVALFQRITRPIDKVFNARGGSTYYNLSKDQQIVFRSYLSNVEWGFTLRKWMDVIARGAYLMDPMGVILMEVSTGGPFETYPTYKSVGGIYDYQLNGRNLDYIIFKTKQENTFRVIDDVLDRMVKIDGETITEIQDQTYVNYFGKVPARIVSDIVNPGQPGFASPLWPCVDDAEEYLREGSVKTIFKLRHGFPKYWQLAQSCSECQGTGYKEAEECPSCKGTGNKLKYDVADVIQVPVPTGKDDPKLTPDLAGYVTPSIEGWQAMNDEQRLLEDNMFQTMWGTHQAQQADGVDKTATASFIDVQPVNERLNKFADWAEDMEKFITDLMGLFYYRQQYGGSAVNYGRRWLIESPDVVWKKYQDARAAGAPMGTLNELLSEYYYCKFANDSLELQKYLKLMKLEPFVHMAPGEASAITGGNADFKAKLYFAEWANSKEETDLMFLPLETLRADLAAYVATKTITAPVPALSISEKATA